jgi:hypothetical protein
MFRLPNRRAVPPPDPAHPSPSARAARVDDPLHAETAARLRPFCGGLPADAFDALVRDVVAFRLRWEAPAGRRGLIP